MEQDIEQTIAVLERTPAAIDALLRGLPEEWTRTNEGEGTWSAFDIVVHLINCEKTDWMPRARVILESRAGEVREFPPFDRWAEIRARQDQALGKVLDDLGRLRAENLRELRSWHLRPEQMEMRGLHPSLGEVTLSQLLATWAAHDLNHLHQMSRVMAHQYRAAVGPWHGHMGVMQCQGHGA